MKIQNGTTVLACTALATSAFAHTTLERAQAPAGSYYKAVLQVGQVEID